MKGLLRWWRYRKLMKCRRDGHKRTTETRDGYMRPHRVEDGSFLSRRAVAYSVTQQRVVCKRCGRTLEPWSIVRSNRLTGLSMPARMHDRLDEHGEVWVR